MARSSRKILIASGVNLDLLGRREPSVYGVATLRDMEKMVKESYRKYLIEKRLQAYQLIFFQSNDEARFLRELDRGYAGAVINAGAWTHTSLALADRLVGVPLPFVEAHVSNLLTRESFRQHSFLAEHAICVVQGLGIQSYWVAFEALLEYLSSAKNPPVQKYRS